MLLGEDGAAQGSHRPFGVTAGGTCETYCWAWPSGQGGQEHGGRGLEGLQQAGPQVPPLKVHAQPRPQLPDSNNLWGSHGVLDLP